MQRLFTEGGVPAPDIAFYNHPRFMRAEADNASVLKLYTVFVHMCPRDADCDTHVKETVPIVTRKLAEEIQIFGAKAG